MQSHCSRYTIAVLTSLTLLTLIAVPVRADAQLTDPGEAVVAMGHLHFQTADLANSQRFWAAMGGVDVENGPLRMFAIPGVFIMLREAEPTGGTVESVINHVGFSVPKRWRCRVALADCRPGS